MHKHLNDYKRGLIVKAGLSQAASYHVRSIKQVEDSFEASDGKAAKKHYLFLMSTAFTFIRKTTYRFCPVTGQKSPVSVRVTKIFLKLKDESEINSGLRE